MRKVLTETGRKRNAEIEAGKSRPGSVRSGAAHIPCPSLARCAYVARPLGRLLANWRQSRGNVLMAATRMKRLAKRAILW